MGFLLSGVELLEPLEFITGPSWRGELHEPEL
jgi:hypothetical protein